MEKRGTAAVYSISCIGSVQIIDTFPNNGYFNEVSAGRTKILNCLAVFYFGPRLFLYGFVSKSKMA
jgi:hypothetical protein